MATPNIVPRADSEGQLGTSSKYWAAAYVDFVYVGAGKVGRDADNLLDFSVDNEVTFRVNAADEMVLGASTLSPHASGGLALGTSSLMWSDLFLASGAVVNFNNGDVTLTHAANNLAISGGNLQYGDNVKAAFGNAGDLNVYHDATNSYIDNEVTGDLYIRQLVDGKDIIFQSDDGSSGTTAYLTLDGSETRIVVSKAMRFDDSTTLQLGGGGDLAIFHDGSNSKIDNSTGNLSIINKAADGDIIFQCDDGSSDGSSVETYFFLDGSSGVTKFPDNKILGLGGGADLQIKHDGTNGQIREHTGNFNIINSADDKDIVFQCDNGAGNTATYFSLDGLSLIHI